MKKWYLFGMGMLLYSLAACGNTKAEEVISSSEQVEVIKGTPTSTISVETEVVDEEQKKTEEMERTTWPKEEIIWMESDEEWEAARNKSNDTLEVTVEREDRSIKNADGNVIARMYYDRPVVSGNSEAAEKINAFFEQEEEDWFAGKSGRLLYEDDYLDYFMVAFGAMRERYGDEELAEWPCIYTVDARIEYLDNDTLSIFQIANYRLEGTGWDYFGCTFDLNTGELLPVTAIKDILPEDMRRIMANASYPTCYENISDDYIMKYEDRELDMRYAYFMDGTYLYLLDNSGECSHEGIAIRCGNGEASVELRYKINDRATTDGRIQTEKIISYENFRYIN